MRRAFLRGTVLVALVAAAGVLGYASYAAVSAQPRELDSWKRAIANAQRAERTKAAVPALRARDDAIMLFDQLAAAGPSQDRSRAAMLAGLLQVENARAQTDPMQGLKLAVSALQRAVRLDPANDDAAFDLELLLGRARVSGHPISSGNMRKTRPKPQPGTSRVGTGY